MSKEANLNLPAPARATWRRIKEPDQEPEPGPHPAIPSHQTLHHSMAGVSHVHCMLSALLTNKIMNINKWLFYTTKFWGGLLCSNRQRSSDEDSF